MIADQTTFDSSHRACRVTSLESPTAPESGAGRLLAMDRLMTCLNAFATAARLGAKGYARRSSYGPSRGNPARGQRHQCEYGNDSAKRQRIVRSNTKEQAAHQPCSAEPAEKAPGDANTGEDHARPERQQEDVARLGSKRHADTELLRSLAYGVSHHAVNPN